MKYNWSMKQKKIKIDKEGKGALSGLDFEVSFNAVLQEDHKWNWSLSLVISAYV